MSPEATWKKHEADFSHLGEEGNLESVNGEPERSSGGTFQKLLDGKQSDTPVNEKPSKAIVRGDFIEHFRNNGEEN